MANDMLIKTLTEQCEVYLDDALISKESIVEKYLKFFGGNMNTEERSINFAFHTGSLCFDAVSIAALMIGCLAYDMSDNDEILRALDVGDMVLYKGGRYHWGGIIKTDVFSKNQPCEAIVLTQDAKGKNGPSSTYLMYERSKHLIRPYYGDSEVTDGRGIRKDKSNRSNFFTSVFGISETEVPTTIGISVVVLADKNIFIDLCKRIRIRYAEDKYVALTDVVPVSYYSVSGEQLQIGQNAAKAEAVIKVTSKLSTARDLVLDKHSNKVIGLLAMNVDSLTSNSTELGDLLRRKSLKFAYVVMPLNAESCELAIEQYEQSQMFACTKELLNDSAQDLKFDNKHTRELNRQISNILTRRISLVNVEGCWSWDLYKDLKEKLFAVKQSNWNGEDKDKFVLSSIALINLFSTSFFPLSTMEEAIANGWINVAVVSPLKRLEEMESISQLALSMRDNCIYIIDRLREMYSELEFLSPKGSELFGLLDKNPCKKIALIVPKAYYVDLFIRYYGVRYKNVTCVTANRFEQQESFDLIVTVGDIVGKRYDSLQCYSAADICPLVYEFEGKTFDHRRRIATKSEKKINAKIKGLTGDDYKKAVQDDDVSEIDEETIQQFDDLDEFVETMGMFDIRRLTTQFSPGGMYSATSEVKYVGVFVTGEQILFSKYYTAVVYDRNAEKVEEKSPEKLLPGDVLVFTKRNDYTSNIVDQIFEQLAKENKLSQEIQEAADKAAYWKAALREFKEANGLTYRAIAKEFNKLGSSIMEVTVRQWLIEESHIVGPRDIKTMQLIGEVTKDSKLALNPESYFEACRIIRHYRREILSLIGKAINEKLSNRRPSEGSAFEVVYQNVDKLSETMELENIFELDEVANITNSMVNRPITEAEVQL